MIKDEYIICSNCGKETNKPKKHVEEGEWKTYKCSTCEGTNYGQKFINWIADRISPSTSDDTTGRFVLRELIQNADDVEANMVILRFREDALYVYNDGFGFRSQIDGGDGDFERISSVLAKHKEKEFYTSGNFGSGFQTVYLFTNFPEVHSMCKSFRYDPTVPKKIKLENEDEIESPYCEMRNKGAVFRLPWRKENNAIYNDFFKEESVWKRWDGDKIYELFKELRDYLHDSLLCCQHLKKIRILWEVDEPRQGYQVERDFILKYVDYDGKVGKILEGNGFGGLLSEEWTYTGKKDFEYLIGSTFVTDYPKQDNQAVPKPPIVNIFNKFCFSINTF